ncbi:hypothetical protein AVEN_257029-1 [Araneus ventricosus]|uniref:Uncharacterized protein n=1 Tax=Araneus ventricosus TaxID=182803 RepID=A0A4Y2NJB9_ARAVE|nr:hypothetical protein AVEN_257029-1 [Araneus ventricosus]
MLVGCRKAGLICSSLCTCSLGEACENVSDINLLEDSTEDEDDMPSSINNFIYEDIEDLYLQLDEEDKEQQTESLKISVLARQKALRCPLREVGNISEIADAGGFTDAGHGMEARLRFKGPFS